jgi:hypothetical protein
MYKKIIQQYQDYLQLKCSYKGRHCSIQRSFKAIKCQLSSVKQRIKHATCFDAQSSLKITVEDLSVMLCQLGKSSNHERVLGYLYLQGIVIQEE